MDIFETFADVKLLPIRLEDIRLHILRQGLVDVIRFYPSDLDPAVLAGFIRVYSFRPLYGPEQLHADISYSTRLDEGWQRLVLCKEMLHLRDVAGALATTVGEVDSLIGEIRIPLSLVRGRPALSDHVGFVHALRLLLPRGALAVLKNHVASGNMTPQAVADLAKIPAGYGDFMLSPAWLGFDEGGRPGQED